MKQARKSRGSGRPPASVATPLKADNRLRIIGGRWRGRKLSFPDVAGLRPTGDRIRETLFNWLAPELPGARCLDIFAGSGALGIEALSRGAAVVTLLERDRAAAASLRSNLALLASEAGKVVEADALAWLQRGNSDEPFDIVFIDPPFAGGMWTGVLEALQQGGWLAEQASVYIESPADYSLVLPASWTLHRDKRAGSVAYRLYYLAAAGAADGH